jgi:hypothetical protein
MEPFLYIGLIPVTVGGLAMYLKPKKCMGSNPRVGDVWWRSILLLYTARDFQSAKLPKKISKQIYNFFTPSPEHAAR